MLPYIKTSLLLLLTLGFGIAIGYYLFGGSALHTHEHPASTSAMATASSDTYTCSMHPQIRQNEPGICPICNMDLTILETNASSDPLILEMTPEAVQLANIQTTVVGANSATQEPAANSSTTRSLQQRTIPLSGKIQADERLAASAVTHVPGRIEQLYVSFTGEQVRKGQKLADIYSPELLTAQQELLEALALQNLNPALLEAARNKLRYWKIDEATITAIEASGTVSERFPIYAEATGVVANRRVAVGDYLRAGEPLFELINLNRLWVLFDAYEEQLAHIQLGNKVSFTSPATGTQVFEGKVSFIDPLIDPRTRVASVRLEIANRGGALKPEMLVYGQLETRTSKDAPLHIPKSAVLWTGERSVVYVKVPNREIPAFQFREVSLGESLGDSYAILTGLEPGEEVVTYGSFSIDAAAQLNNQASMMNQDIAIKSVPLVEVLPDYTELAPLTFKKQLASTVQQYLIIKDALVATDAAAVKAQADNFTASISTLDPSTLTGEAQEYANTQIENLKAHAAQLASANEVEAQRTQFVQLSDILISLAKVYGVPDDTYYIQHCPMAFDNTGADWLSNEEQIANPYFGDRMLRCGVVDEVIGE